MLIERTGPLRVGDWLGHTTRKGRNVLCKVIRVRKLDRTFMNEDKPGDMWIFIDNQKNVEHWTRVPDTPLIACSNEYLEENYGRWVANLEIVRGAGSP